MAEELKTIKFQMMLSESEAAAIDDWGFARRIRSRAEVIRRLCQMAIQADPLIGNVASVADELMDLDKKSAEEIEKVRDDPPAYVQAHHTAREEQRLRHIDLFFSAQQMASIWVHARSGEPLATAAEKVKQLEKTLLALHRQLIHEASENSERYEAYLREKAKKFGLTDFDRKQLTELSGDA